MVFGLQQFILKIIIHNQNISQMFQFACCLFLGGVFSLLTELFAVWGIVFILISYQWIEELVERGLMIFGLMMSLFWITRIHASLSWMPRLLVHDVIVMRLSENLSIPSGQIEWDLIIILKLFLFKNEFRLSGPKLTILFCFYGSLT